MSEFFRFSASSKSKVYSPRILNSEDYFAKCSKCGSVYLKNKISNIDLIVEGKGKYPDILLCGHWPIVIVSDRVLNNWRENNISGFHSCSVRLFRNNGEEISKNEVYYHNIIITGRSALDLDAMGVKINSKCKTCGTVKYNKETWEFGKPIIKQSSWDGSDLFAFEQFLNTSVCGVKNLELIYNNKFTNFSITRMEDMFDYCSSEINIKKLFID